jgi:hypothetical protein
VRGERDPEEVGELAVEVHRPALRVLDAADEDVGQRAEAIGEEAERDALAGAGIAGEHREPAVGDPELDAAEVAVDRGRREKRIDRNVGAKRMELEAVQGQELAHESSSGVGSERVSSFGT